MEDHELDRSEALPDVVDCCDAFQCVLRQSAERAVLLSGIGCCGEEGVGDGGGGGGEMLEELARRAMLTLVKGNWFAYLKSWQKAVEYF